MSEVETLARDLSSLAVVDAPVAELRGWDRNPRRIKPARLEQLKAMLTASPEMLRARPLIALPDGTVIAGNQRLAAAQALGWESIPAVFVDLDEATAIEWAFRDNNPAGESDDDLAAVLLADLAERGRALDMTGFAPSDLSALLRRVAPKNDPDAVPPVPKKPKSKRGEIYELGNHRLMCGDATSAEDVAALMGGSSVALLFTDPPYGVNYQGDEDPESLRRRNRRTDGKATVAGDALGDDGTRALVSAALATARTGMAPGATFYVCSPSGMSELAFRLALQDASFELRQAIVWAKDVFAFGRQDYHWRHESILYGWLAGAAHLWNGGRKQDTVWEIARPKRSPEHPTMKPVELVERALWNSSDPEKAVLDPFAGSGSTLIAAEQSNRRCFALEIDPAYCDVIRQRYADFVNDQKWAP